MLKNTLSEKTLNALWAKPDFHPVNKPFPDHIFYVIWHYFLRNKFSCLFFTCFYVMASLAYILLPFALKDIIDLLSLDQSQSEIKVLLYPALVFFIAIAVTSEVAQRLAGLARYFFTTNIVAQIRVELFSYIQHHSHHFFINHFAGSIGNKITQTSSAIRDVFYLVIMDFLPLILSFLLTAYLVYDIHHGLSFLFLGWLIVFFGTTALATRAIAMRSLAYARERSLFTGQMIDILTNISTVRSHAGHDQEFSNIKYYAQRLNFMGRYAVSLVEIMRVIQGVFVLGLICGVLYLAMQAWEQGMLTIGDLAFLLPASLTLSKLAGEAASRLINLFEYTGTIKEGLAYLTRAHDLTDHQGATPLKLSKGEVSINDMSFSYHSGDQVLKVFDQLNITIKPGEKIGLLGHSGAGKSSLISLLLRFYDPDAGDIRIDNTPIDKVTQESLRQHIAYIPQDTQLFHRSVADNISYGIEATREEIIEAARQAQAHEFIETLSHGYDTIVGERGLKLSGGQRQRIAIARAILRNAPILILDEATSALDSESEKAIQKSLITLMKGKTVIAIAHRLSTIAHMDRLLVMDQGKIIEEGTHQQLQKQDGHYAKLWRLQSDNFIPE